MFVLKAHIEIGPYTFDQVHELSITRSVDLITDTAVIELPTKFALRSDEKQSQKLKTTDAIKVGQAVSITIGYKGVIERLEFVGVVTAVKPNTPVSIHCEDATWHLRSKNCNKNFAQTTLRQLMQYILEGQEITLSSRIPPLRIHKCLFKGCNGLQALQQLKRDYGLRIFLDDHGQLFAGFIDAKTLSDQVDYQMGYNVIAQDLEFKTRDAIKLKVKLIGLTDENKHITAEAGDSGGAQRTIHRYDVSDQAELQKIADSKLKALQYDGYRGTLTSFLTPLADRGMIARLQDDRYPERSGCYFIPSVVITYGMNGARRKVELGIKLP